MTVRAIKLTRLKKWTPAIARRLTLSRLAKIEGLLVDIAYLWGDEDQFLHAYPAATHKR